MMSDRVRAMIESSDLDALVRTVDALSSGRQWDELEALRDGCLEAVERGKQLWAIAQLVDYRLALEAPGPRAAAVLRDGAGRNSLGPLWEVAASTHTWEELAPWTEVTRQRTLVAHERALRGEDFEPDGIDPQLVDVPLVQAPWEPGYPTAEYLPDRAHFPESSHPELQWTDLPPADAPSGESIAGDALLALVAPWVEESSGRAEVRSVVGGGPGAIAALGLSRVRLGEVALGDAVAHMVWTAASGGAFGRRRGTAVGRGLVWWALACLTGLEDDWPLDARTLGDAAAGLRWYLWDPGDVVGGWNFHIAVEDPLDGLAWAVAAVDWK